MAASIIPFRDRRANSRESSSRRQGIHTVESGKDTSQTQAHRIVAQIEREIANRAYKRAQLRLKSPATLIGMEAPNSIVARILRAIKCLTRPA